MSETGGKRWNGPAAMSLPAKYYVDPDYYREELEWLFFSMWFRVGRSEEIAGRGDFFTCEIGGDNVIVVRDDLGEMRAFHNVCRHRGTRLTEERAGRFGSRIQCPYHAWNFELNGCLAGAPHMEKVEGFRVEDYPLMGVAVSEWDGHVFLNFQEKPAPLRDQLEGYDDRFRPWGMERLRAAKRIVYDVAANWKLIIHNYSECLHCPGVHPALQKLSHYLSGENEPSGVACLGGRMTLKDGIGTLSSDGVRRQAILPGLNEDDSRHVYFYAFLPNFLLSLHPDYVITHTLWPRGEGRTEIVCEWLFEPSTIERGDFDPEDILSFWDLTNRQDWHVCEQMQLGLRSRGYRPGPYSYREELLDGFDRLILEREAMAKAGRLA
jgi:glycine betaine catabolism A